MTGHEGADRGTTARMPSAVVRAARANVVAPSMEAFCTPISSARRAISAGSNASNRSPGKPSRVSPPAWMDSRQALTREADRAIQGLRKARCACQRTPPGPAHRGDDAPPGSLGPTGRDGGRENPQLARAPLVALTVHHSRQGTGCVAPAPWREPMAYKRVLFRMDAREKILRGVTALSDAVRVPLGPKSKCSSSRSASAYPSSATTA